MRAHTRVDGQEIGRSASRPGDEGGLALDEVGGGVDSLSEDAGDEDREGGNGVDELHF